MSDLLGQINGPNDIKKISVKDYDALAKEIGHQCYTHKLLTGRKDGFGHLRQYGGISGFPKRAESACDAIDTGHSSTSIGAALGLAKARDIRGENHKVFAVIGDGALSGGMAYEALNNAARLKLYGAERRCGEDSAEDAAYRERPDTSDTVD